MQEKKYKKIDYVLFTPKIPKDKIKGVIFNMHGAGARGNDLTLIKNIKIFEYATKNEKTFPFIIVSPQCYADSWFDIFEQVQDFAEFVKSEYSEYPLFYVGYSMGAYAGWQLVQSKPDMFKKAVLFCGGGLCWSMGRIKTEIWAIHGKEDQRVSHLESLNMANVVNGYGGKVKLTLLDGVNHDCWERYYVSDEIYEFLLEE